MAVSLVVVFRVVVITTTRDFRESPEAQSGGFEFEISVFHRRYQ
jgi:hypothetical protein